MGAETAALSPAVDGCLNGRASGKHPGRAGQMHRNRMDVHPGDGRPQAVKRLSRFQIGSLGRVDEVHDGFGHKCPGAAGGIEDVLIERIGYNFPNHRPRQPVRRVVLAQLPALGGRDDAFVQDGGNIGRGVQPAEPGDAVRHGSDQRLPTDFDRPGKEVRFHDARQAGITGKTASQQQVVRVVPRQLADVNAKGRLHDHADHDAQVGVTDEEVVQVCRGLGNLAEGRHQQVAPEPPLDLDGLLVRM